jgi:hypothetical protein
VCLCDYRMSVPNGCTIQLEISILYFPSVTSGTPRSPKVLCATSTRSNSLLEVNTSTCTRSKLRIEHYKYHLIYVSFRIDHTCVSECNECIEITKLELFLILGRATYKKGLCTIVT